MVNREYPEAKRINEVERGLIKAVGTGTACGMGTEGMGNTRKRAESINPRSTEQRQATVEAAALAWQQSTELWGG